MKASDQLPHPNQDKNGLFFLKWNRKRVKKKPFGFNKNFGFECLAFISLTDIDCYSYIIKVGKPTFPSVVMKLFALTFLFAQLKPNWN